MTEICPELSSQQAYPSEADDITVHVHVTYVHVHADVAHTCNSHVIPVINVNFVRLHAQCTCTCTCMCTIQIIRESTVYFHKSPDG